MLQSAKGVENGELARGVQQRLMIVRAVHIHQPFANLLEHGQRGCAAVDKLTITAGGRERALEEQLIVFARLEAVLLQKRGQR